MEGSHLCTKHTWSLSKSLAPEHPSALPQRDSKTVWKGQISGHVVCSSVAPSPQAPAALANPPVEEDTAPLVNLTRLDLAQEFVV